MDATILWIVIGVAVLLVIIGIIYAVTRNSDDRGVGRRPRGRAGGVGSEPSTAAPRAGADHDADAQKRRRGRRDGGRPPR